MTKQTHLFNEVRRTCFVTSNREVNAICHKTALTFWRKELVPVSNHQVWIAICCFPQCAIEANTTRSPVGATGWRKFKIDPKNWNISCLFHHCVDCVSRIPRFRFRDHVVGAKCYDDCGSCAGEFVGNDPCAHCGLSPVLCIKDDLCPNVGPLRPCGKFPEIVGTKRQTVSNHKNCSLPVGADCRLTSSTGWYCRDEKKRDDRHAHGESPTKCCEHGGSHCTIVAR